MTRPNEYSEEWFRYFLEPFSPERTQRQVAFLKRQIPLPVYSRVLDVCAGSGRIAGPLAETGYEVTALDSNAATVRSGSGRWPTVRFVEGDMRALVAHAGQCDAVVCLWQSFGYFDETTNRSVLAGMAECLRPGGRLILDLYHRGFLETIANNEKRIVDGMSVESSSRLVGRRWNVELAYGNGAREMFDWEVFTPAEFVASGTAAGLQPILSCADFNENIPATGQRQSFQAVFEKWE